MIAKQAKGAKDKHSLGNILVKDGLITENDLDRALAYQNDHQDEMLGCVLVKLNLMDEQVLEAYLLKQRAIKHPRSDAATQLVELAKKHTNDNTLTLQALHANTK